MQAMASMATRERGGGAWTTRIVQSRWWPAAVASGLAFTIPASINEGWLARGGLAPLAAAAIVAIFVGAPSTVAERSAADVLDEESTLGRAVRALAELLGLLLVAALSAPLVASLGLTGQGAALLAWVGLIFLVQRLGDAPTVVFAGLALLLAAFGAATALTNAPPWTLLAPTWTDARAWAPGAVTIGLLLAPAAVGQWSSGPEVPPGGGRLAWTTAGLALLFALASAARAGARFEAALGAEVVDPGASATLVAALLAAASSLLARRGTQRALWSRAGVGLLATLWFVGPGAAALDPVLDAVLPVGVALVLAATARYAHGAPRVAAGVGALLALAAAVTGPAVLPASVGGAAALGLTLVAMFWYVAARSVEFR